MVTAVDTLVSTIIVEVPRVQKQEYTLLDVDTRTGCVSVVTEAGDTKDDLNLPSEDEEQYIPIGETIVALYDQSGNECDQDGWDKVVFVTTMIAMGKEVIVDCRVEDE